MSPVAQLTARVISPEHMDDPAAGRAALAGSLAYIRSVNRHLRGTAAAIGQFQRWSSAWQAHETIRVLDVGTGSGDIPLALAQWAKAAGHALRITAIDRHPVTLDLAREFIGAGGAANIDLRLADALKLMDVFEPGAFDYAHAGMFLHHLNDIEVMTVLRIMDRLTTRGLIWNDLIRGWIGRLGVRVLTLSPRVPREVKHDAIVSVDAGFTKREAIDLAQRAGLPRIGYHRHLLHRFTLISEKA